MYRCSLSCRVVRQFESVNSIQPLCTRYDVFCPQLHFSLSDTQLPMFLRLLQLALALYYGDLGAASVPEQSAAPGVPKDVDGLLLEGNVMMMMIMVRCFYAMYVCVCVCFSLFFFMLLVYFYFFYCLFFCFYSIFLFFFIPVVSIFLNFIIFFVCFHSMFYFICQSCFSII